MANALSWIRMEWRFVRGKNNVGQILKHFIMMKIFFEILHTLQVAAPGPPAQTIPSVIYPGKISSHSSWEWIGIWIHCKWFGRNKPPPLVRPHPIWKTHNIRSGKSDNSKLGSLILFVKKNIVNWYNKIVQYLILKVANA